MQPLQLDLMTRTEKLQAMEALWQDLSRDPEEFISPAWHAEELAKTEVDVAEGRQKFVDWDVARQELNGQ